MDNKVSLLITILYNESTLRCALKVDKDMLDDDVFSFPMEPENKAKIAALLPLHIKENSGPIIDVEQIFDIVVM